jgi:hypothetical protein
VTSKAALWLLIVLAFSSPALGIDSLITIPVEIVDGNNIATVEAGGTTLRAHIDTGGYKTIGVSTEALSRMSVRFLPETITRTDGSGAKFSGRTFVIPELKIGGRLFRDVPGFERLQALTGDFGDPAAFEAVLGRDFLSQFTVVVDYPRRKFELHPPDAGKRICGSPTAQLATTPEGFWASTVETDHGNFKMVWDTGARGASFIQARLVAERRLPIKDDAYVSQRFRIGSRDLGPIELVPIALTGFPAVDGLLGVSIFGSHRVCFDGNGSGVSIQ